MSESMGDFWIRKQREWTVGKLEECPMCNRSMTAATRAPEPRYQGPTAAEQIGNEIVNIMQTYDEQMRERGSIGTPGGLEHMGDVWRMLREWAERLADAGPRADRPAASQPLRLEKSARQGPCSACGDGDTAMEFHTHEAVEKPAGREADTPDVRPGMVVAINYCLFHYRNTGDSGYLNAALKLQLTLRDGDKVFEEADAKARALNEALAGAKGDETTGNTTGT